MANKNVQKSSSKIKLNKLLKKKLRIMIVKKSLYSSLTIFSPFQNLVNVTLHECKFNFLAKEFSTLYNLQELEFFQSLAVNRTQSAWERLEQIPVKNNLELLEIRNNSQPISFLHIICLENYTKLFIYWIRIDLERILQEKFGVPLVFHLGLQCNNLGRCGQFVWEWLMQAPIRNNLRELDLSNNYLTELPIQMINNIKNLYILCLRNNKFKFLPKEFGNLSQLIKLDLSENMLGKGGHSTWNWLENPIKDNLLYLHIRCNLLTEFPLQITCITNLCTLNISDNKIKFLPKELGTLPHLTYLNLTKNHLGTSYSPNAWEWLEQSSIRNNLLQLYLSENRLTRLPPQIGLLHALTILYLCDNKLKCLPHTFTHLTNLEELDLYDNDLLYLPGSLADLSTYIDVDVNPFNLEDNNDNFSAKSEVPCLMKCSAEIILRSGLYYLDILPKALVRYMEYEKYYCSFCKTLCFTYYGKRFIKYSEYKEIMCIKFDATSNINNASFECFACSPVCVRKLWN